MLLKKTIQGIVIVASMILLVYAATEIHYIDQKACTKCGLCISECPEEAIIVVKKDGKEIHTIDQDKCIQCGICIEGCPEEAIKVGTKDSKK